MQADYGLRKGGSVSMAWQIRKRSHEAKTVVSVTSSEEMRCSQVKEDFFLYEQRCSVGQALASHVRGQRKFNREQENPRVRGEVGIANPFGSIISSHDPRHPTVPTLVDRSTNRHHHKAPRGLPLRLFSTHCNPRQASSSTTESRHRRAHLIVANPIHRGNLFSACSSS
jgi:hypothetical protein